MTDDAELLRRYAEEKSEDAFAELVRRHIDFVYAAALRQARGNAPLAQDVAQVVFTDLARKAATLARHEVVVGWLHTATRFAVAKAIRSESRRTAREQEGYAMNEALGESDAPVDWARLHPVLDDVLGELKERERAAILLRFFEKKPLAEVGAKLSLTESAARSCVDRALEKMRTLLSRRGVNSTAAALGVALTNSVGVAAPAGLAAKVSGAALAGAGSGAATTLGLVNFMSTTKLVAVASTLIALVAIGTAIREAREVRELEDLVASTRAERDAMRARLVATFTTPVDRPAVAVTASPRTELTPPPAPAKSAGSELDHVLANPEARSAYLKRATLALKIRFERFFQTAGLTGEQQDRFLNLMMDDAEGRLDALKMRRDAGAFDPGGSTMDRAAIERVREFQKQRDDEVTQGLRELLGDKFKQAMEILTTVNERNVADKLASRLYYTDSPLTAQQSEELIKVLAQNGFVNKTDTAGGAVISGELSSRRLYLPLSQAMPWMLDDLISDAAVARAAGVITPTQLGALRVLQAQQIAELQVLPPVPSKDGQTK